MIKQLDSKSNIHKLINFFINNIAKCELLNYFNFNISDNIDKDILRHIKTKRPEINCIFGITILPTNKKEKLKL